MSQLRVWLLDLNKQTNKQIFFRSKIDKINDKIIINKEMNEIMNINDERAKKFNNYICYECSGLNGINKPVYKIIIHYMN